MSPGFQQTRGLLQDDCYPRIIRRDKGRENLSHVRHATPFVACKQLNSALLDNGLKPIRLDAKLKFTDLRFVEARQAFDIEGSRNVANLELRFRRDSIDEPGSLADYRWCCTKRDAHVSECFLCRIFDFELAYDRNVVLRRGEVDPMQSAANQGHHPWLFLLARGIDHAVSFYQILIPLVSVRGLYVSDESVIRRPLLKS